MHTVRIPTRLRRHHVLLLLHSRKRVSDDFLPLARGGGSEGVGQPECSGCHAGFEGVGLHEEVFCKIAEAVAKVGCEAVGCGEAGGGQEVGGGVGGPGVVGGGVVGRERDRGDAGIMVDGAGAGHGEGVRGLGFGERGVEDGFDFVKEGAVCGF